METKNVITENAISWEKEAIAEEKVIKMQKPTSAFVGASWFALLVGMVSYCIGLWNAEMQLNEKGYYFTILLFGLFSVISVQKAVRDKMEGIPISDIYYSISWFATIISILLLIIGLWNADLQLSEKGFYAMSYLLSMFSAITVQKNTRDNQLYNSLEKYIKD